MSGNDGGNAPAPTTMADWPQSAKDYIAELRNEAANWRVKFKDQESANTTLANEVVTLKDKVSAAESDGTKAVAESKRLRIALEAGVPGDRAVSIAGRLQGSTDDELKADAAKLVADFGLTGQQVPRNDAATDPSQGQGSGGAATTLTPGGAWFAKQLRDSTS
jgi:hypothetical protein